MGSAIWCRSKPTVDLIIPARNEQANIHRLLANLPRKILRHVILVNNGSTDRTAALARSGGLVVRDEPQRGYGAACLTGLVWIGQLEHPPDMVAFVDADLADDPKCLPSLIRPIADGRAALVIGSRSRLAAPGSLTTMQRLGNRLSCAMIRMLTGRRYSDMGPMRVVRYDALIQMDMTDRTWGWTVEMQFKAAAMGLTTIDVDVPYRCRQAGQSKISGTWLGSTWAGGRIIVTILKLWAQHSLGRLRQNVGEHSR